MSNDKELQALADHEVKSLADARVKYCGELFECASRLIHLLDADDTDTALLLAMSANTPNGTTEEEFDEAVKWKRQVIVGVASLRHVLAGRFAVRFVGGEPEFQVTGLSDDPYAICGGYVNGKKHP